MACLPLDELDKVRLTKLNRKKRSFLRPHRLCDAKWPDKCNLQTAVGNEPTCLTVPVELIVCTNQRRKGRRNKTREGGFTPGNIKESESFFARELLLYELLQFYEPTAVCRKKHQRGKHYPVNNSSGQVAMG